ncbi:MAG: hypothetical protein JSV68_13180 [Anaerolineaceae bacterium]|nr:MAG: hypothetical protein JSV68_13180 [Anaerolineaceae bacterium]
MKSSAYVAISLALIMLLLVLSAALFFLLQGKQDLEGALQSSTDENRSLEQQQAELELEKSAAQSTVESLDALQATASLENMDLNEQLVKTDQIKATLEVTGAQLSSDLENARATLDAHKSQGPIVNIVEPQEGATFIVDQPVNLVVVASDVAEISAVNFNVDTMLFGGPVEEGQQSVTVRKVWIPQTEGSFTLVATAVNKNGILSKTFEREFTVVLPPTSTPEPSATTEPTPVTPTP